jgi:hypothetical protein
VATFGPGDVHEAQVHIEATGGCVSLEAAARVTNLRGATVIFRNDATGALAAFRKGSSHSSTLQKLAVRMTTLCAELEINPLFLHAPGKELVEEGIVMHRGALLLRLPVPRTLITSDASCIRQRLIKDGRLLLTSLQQRNTALRSASFQSLLSLGRRQSTPLL